MGTTTYYITVLSIFYFAHIMCVHGEDKPTVTIKDGTIVGKTMKSVKDREYSEFTGIPYAQPPIDELRFMAPQPVEPWEIPLQPKKKKPKPCPQLNPFTGNPMGDENCLFINVYTPQLSGNSDSLLPVMVYIHGGLYYMGSGQNYGPQKLMDKDVVLATFNYRLGALGFLSTSTEALKGNYGLFDQIFALHWVQENIAAFGGDKNRVTIFGNDAGASSVTVLLISPLSAGLFHGAIVQSGSVLCNWATASMPVKAAKYLALKLNCPTHPLDVLAKCIKEKPWKMIIEKSKDFQIIPGFVGIFKPTVDNQVIPDNPRKLFQEGKLNKVPVLIGITQNEGVEQYTKMRHWYPRTGREFMKKYFIDAVAMDVEKMLMFKEKKIMAGIEERYLSDVDLEEPTAFYETMIKIMGDMSFSCTQFTARFIANSTGHPTYVYTFTHRGQHSNARLFPEEDLGVSHEDELQHLFILDKYSREIVTETDAKMADLLLLLWTNFAAHGNPTPGEESGVQEMPFVWTPYETDRPLCTKLNLDPQETNECEAEHSDFWNTDLANRIE